jgi:chromosome segregation ATPase
MSGRVQNVKNSAILEAIETLQNNLNENLTPIATLTADISKIKQNIQTLQDANSQVNTFIQQTHNDITEKFLFIKDEITTIEENSTALKKEFEEFKQTIERKLDSITNNSAVFDQTLLKNRRQSSIQVVNKLEETMNFLPNKKYSETHPILQSSIRRRMKLNIKRNEDQGNSRKNLERDFLFDPNCSITTQKNQEILDNYINEYMKTYESQKDMLGK